MKNLLFLILVFAAPVFGANEEPQMMKGKPEISLRTRRLARNFELDIQSGRLAEKTNKATDAIIRLAVYQLRRTGHVKEGNQLLKEWEEQWQFFIPAMILQDGIGDHRPMSQWLAEKCFMLELILGKEVMHALRLDDLITINYALPVVIRCIDNVDELEFYLHFVADDGNGYRGLGPVVAYWGTFFGCVGFTWGTGFLFCSPIAMGVEWLAKSYVCPRLNAPLWNLSCRP